jgi:hypothetical protein
LFVFEQVRAIIEAQFPDIRHVPSCQDCSLPCLAGMKLCLAAAAHCRAPKMCISTHVARCAWLVSFDLELAAHVWAVA